MSVLGDAAAILAAGNWAQLSAAADQVAVCGVAPGGAPYTLAMNEAAWDPVAKKAHHVCKQSGSPLPVRHLVYDEASHAWSTLDDNIGIPDGTGSGGHGYDSLVINPATGRLYWKDFWTNRVFYWADSSAYAWNVANISSQWPTSGSVVAPNPHWFWTGSRSVGGNQGFWMVALDSDSAQGTGDLDVDIAVFDVQANDWVATNQKIVDAIPTGGGTFQHWGSYSAVHNCAVIILGYGGAGDGKTGADYRTWRINANGTSTALPNPPTRVGYLVGSITCDPVSGDFLVLGDDGSFHRLDPTGSGTWSTLTSADALLWPLGSTPTVCWPVPEHGVTVWHNGLEGDMFIFKLARAAPVPKHRTKRPRLDLLDDDQGRFNELDVRNWM